MLFRNKCSPYEGRKLTGVVTETWLRGERIFTREDGFIGKGGPSGRLLLKPRIKAQEALRGTGAFLPESTDVLMIYAARHNIMIILPEIGTVARKSGFDVQVIWLRSVSFKHLDNNVVAHSDIEERMQSIRYELAFWIDQKVLMFSQ